MGFGAGFELVSGSLHLVAQAVRHHAEGANDSGQHDENPQEDVPDAAELHPQQGRGKLVDGGQLLVQRRRIPLGATASEAVCRELTEVVLEQGMELGQLQNQRPQDEQVADRGEERPIISIFLIDPLVAVISSADNRSRVTFASLVAIPNQLTLGY